MRIKFNTDSCIETSTCWPRPVAWRWLIAARMAMAICMPVPLSPIEGQLYVGGPSATPVTHMAPPIAWKPTHVCAGGPRLVVRHVDNTQSCEGLAHGASPEGTWKLSKEQTG